MFLLEGALRMPVFIRKRRWLCAAIFLSGPALVAAAGHGPGNPVAANPAADALWAQIEQLVDQYGDTEPPPARVHYVRELALEFYETYPGDPRTADLRRAFLTVPGKDPFEPFRKISFGLAWAEGRAANGYWDLEARAEALLLKAADGRTGADELLSDFSYLHLSVRALRPGELQERAILTRLKTGSSETLRNLVAGRERFLALREEPLEMTLPATGGARMDLRDLRGKVVLLDFWNLNCSSCIAAMPRIQTLYEKYRARGFEVVGVFLPAQVSAEAQTREVTRGRQIMERQGATWPHAAMVGEGVVQEFKRLYSIRGVPRLWLLDQAGRLALDVDPGRDFDGSRAGRSPIEQEINRLLNAGVTPGR